MSDDQAMTQLPRWKCHKEVFAAKIAGIEPRASSEPTRLLLDLGSGEPRAFADMDADWLAKHQPEVGGYYVQYEDGYKSYSPAAAFESGYTRIR
jgi:hypothetical protein